MTTIYYPMGAGGRWLKSTIALIPLEDKQYVNFHESVSVNSWVNLRHLNFYSGNGLIFSGTNYFNFFVNHIYKHYHHEHDLFNNKDYADYWMTIVAASFGICQADKFLNALDFNFDDLVTNPIHFYNSIVNLQKESSETIIDYDDFLYRREKFIDSCVNIDGIVENFDNMIWVAFVLGQLMFHNIHPSFSIAELPNQDLCKKFAQENYHRCQLRNFTNFDSQVFLPNFKDLS